MQIEVTQNVFRFMLLHHINELLINKELIINSIRKAVVPVNVPRTPEEVDDGKEPYTDPLLKKNLNQILRDLQAFALSGGDGKRNAASESTPETEISVDNDSADITNKSFMLESAWGYINKDELGNELVTELEEGFNSYLSIVREIASWTMMLNSKQNDTNVQLGASSVSTLLNKWGPVDLNDTLDDFYVELFEHVKVYALGGKVQQLLDSTPIGIAVRTGIKRDVKFDSEGFVTIRLPIARPDSETKNHEFYLTKVDYYNAGTKACGNPEIESNVIFEECDNQFDLQLTSINGQAVCKTEVRTQRNSGSPYMLDPPLTYDAIDPKVIDIRDIEPCCAPPVSLQISFGCTPQDDRNDFLSKGARDGVIDYDYASAHLTPDDSCLSWREIYQVTINRSRTVHYTTQVKKLIANSLKVEVRNETYWYWHSNGGKPAYKHSRRYRKIWRTVIKPVYAWVTENRSRTEHYSTVEERQTVSSNYYGGMAPYKSCGFR